LSEKKARVLGARLCFVTADTVSELDDEEESYEHSIFADLGDDSDIPGDERMIEAEARAGAGVFANKGRK